MPPFEMLYATNTYTDRPNNASAAITETALTTFGYRLGTAMRMIDAASGITTSASNA